MLDISSFSPSGLVKQLQKDELFVSWIKNHSKNYLSHLFCQLTPDFVFNGSWEIGFFDPSENKITVFLPLENGTFAIKPADEIFKQKEAVVEELEISKVKITLIKSKEIFDNAKPKYFPKEQLGNGFIILQTLNDKTLWNVTFITKTLKFANIKINAMDESIVENNLINFVEK